MAWEGIFPFEALAGLIDLLLPAAPAPAPATADPAAPQLLDGSLTGNVAGALADF